MIRMGSTLKNRVILLAASIAIAALGLGLYFKGSVVSIACAATGHVAQADTCERQTDDGQIYFASCSGFF